MEEVNCTSKKPTEVFNTLAKIKAASYRVGFNIWDLYRPLDPNKNNVISVSKFISVLAGPLKNIIGLTDEEITTVSQYFKQADGRVMYSQFCNYVQGEEIKEEKEDDGKKEETFQRNILVPEEEKYLLMMITKIAITVKRKNMYLQPYFQDYALVSKGSGGLVSRSTVARVLNEVGVKLSTHDYNLLLRKYSKDAFTVCYTALLEDIDAVRRYLEENNALDINGDLLPKFAGRLDGWDLPQLPRPETVEPQESLVGLHMLYKPEYKTINKQAIHYTMQKIRCQLQKEKLLIEPLLERYDTVGSGRMTQAQFRLVLADMSRDSSGLAPLSLTREDVSELGLIYADPTDKERILWRAFSRDVNKCFKPEELKNWPKERELYLKKIAEKRARERQALTWAQMDHPAPPPESLESVLTSIKKRLVKRNINLHGSFLKYDSDNFGMVSRSDMRKCMVDNCILCTESEYKLLEDKYLTKGSFCYADMLNDINKTLLSGEVNTELKENDPLYNFSEKFEEEKRKTELERENDIIEVLAKIKRQLICLKIQLIHYLKPLDKNSEGLLEPDEFKSTLLKCSLNLTDNELQTVINVFKAKNCHKVEYLKFCRTVDEESEKPCIFRLPLKEEMARVEKGRQGYEHPFLNYVERRMASITIKNLSSKISLGQLDAFKKMDVKKNGLVTKYQFMSHLHSLGVLNTMSAAEIDNIMKAFGVMPAGQLIYSLDYHAFLNAVDIAYRQYKAAS